MYRVTSVQPRDKFRLYVEFSDGVRGEVSLAKRLFGPVFEPLKNPKLFVQVDVDEFGAVCWPNGADLAPDALHRQLANKPTKRRTSRLKLAARRRG
jgi:hypothetical protein